MIIRPARDADVPAVTALVRQAYEPYVARIGVRPAPLDADYATLVAADAVVVAEVDGAVAGVLVLGDHPDHVLVENVAVATGARAGGIGRALLGHAEDRALSRGVPEVRLYTHRLMSENRAYYSRRGYVETRRTDDDRFSRVHFTKIVSDGAGRQP